ncbi:MAG: hypothetical protein IPL21_06605 [Saprospirales bacterium]|nr:hypothetical protein [Saprospirales bacterium]
MKIIYLVPKYPLTMTVKDIATNIVVQTSQINNGYLNITPKIAGRNYLITISDACGDIYALIPSGHSWKAKCFL